MAATRTYTGPGSGEAVAAFKHPADNCTFLDGFESGLTPWSITDFGAGSHSLETSVVHAGAKSLKTISPASNGDDVIGFSLSTPPDVSAYGSTVKIGIWIKRPDGWVGGSGSIFDIRISSSYFWKMGVLAGGQLYYGTAGTLTGQFVDEASTDWHHFVLTVDRSSGAYVSMTLDLDTVALSGDDGADVEPGVIDAAFRAWEGTMYFDNFCLHDG